VSLQQLTITPLLRLLCLPFFVLLLFAGTTRAIPLESYRKNIQRVITLLDTVAVNEESEAVAERQARVNETFASTRALMPLRQKVEWANQEYNVDNSWLHQALEKVEKTAAPQQPGDLRFIQDRLKAIDERIQESANLSSIPLTKDEAKRKLDEILARPNYATKPAETSAFSRLIARFLRWLASLFGRRDPVQPETAYRITQYAQIIVIVLALALIAYVLRLLAPRFQRRRGAKKEAKPQARVVLGERLAPDQSAADLLSEAEALARQGELRAAIRKAYIALLVELGDRKVISLAQHKTNHDYLNALRERRKLYGRVATMTDSFERHWYGVVKASDNDWAEFRARYREALQE
jgi:Domain of unknown function (DUF4129)